MKILWNKPELVVLVRRKADEVILTNCKESSGGSSSQILVCGSVLDKETCATFYCRGN